MACQVRMSTDCTDLTGETATDILQAFETVTENPKWKTDIQFSPR